MIDGTESRRSADLRERAETALQSVDANAQADAAKSLSPEELKGLVDDIWTYRVELEMQNDELLRSQAALASARDRYLELYDFAPVGYFTIDEGGAILDANLTAATLLGRERSSLVGTAFASYVAEGQHDRFHAYHQKLAQGDVSVSMTLVFLRLDNASFHGRLIGSLVSGAPGVCRLALTNVEDAVQTEARFTMFFDDAPIGKVIAAPNGAFTRVNPAFCRMLGYTNEEMLGMSFSDIAHPDDAGRGPDLAWSLLPGEPEARAMETRYRTKDGRTLWTHVTTKVQRDGAGRPLSFMAHVFDIGERRRLQARTAESERLAGLGTLAAALGHELNNPLTFVMANIEGLTGDLPEIFEHVKRYLGVVGSSQALAGAERAELPELQGEHEAILAMCDDTVTRLRDALDGAQRIKLIVHSLGHFARIERLEVGPVDVASCVASALKLALSEIRPRARVVEDYATLPPALAVESNLIQALFNLLVSTAQSIESGHASENEIRIRTWADSEHVQIEVRDTSPGVAPEDQEHVFSPFFSLKTPGTGLGLGLSICKKIVTDVGGDITFTSELGKGSCFQIQLRRAPPNSANADAVPSQPATPSSAFGRVLVVDDEEAIRRLLVRLLRGHEVVLAASGKEARALLEKDVAFDLVLCDLMMPAVSGTDLHAWLSGYDTALAERVVFMSGGVFTPGVSAYLSKVENLRITKPFDMAQLTKLVNERIGAYRARAVTHAP